MPLQPITTKFRINGIPWFERFIDWQNSPQRAAYEAELFPRLYAEAPEKDRFELPPSAVTEKLIHALESRRPSPRYFITTPTYIAAFLMRVLPTRAVDRILLRL